MEKLGGFIANWQRRYFVLDGHVLAYFGTSPHVYCL